MQLKILNQCYLVDNTKQNLYISREPMLIEFLKRSFKCNLALTILQFKIQTLVPS